MPPRGVEGETEGMGTEGATDLTDNAMGLLPYGCTLRLREVKVGLK